TLIIPTNGFQIFKDKEKMELLQSLALTRGILILTDSDHAGFMIRNRLKQAITKGKVYHGYIPDVYGKEKRKAKPSAEGKLGVEGMSTDILQQVLAQAGVIGLPARPKENPITKADFVTWGLSGTSNASQKRSELQKRLSLPTAMSANTLLEVLNRLFAREEIEQQLEQMKNSCQS
ncbi:MAG: DUF4093 domain-containing protein, partial [Clostridia bacterium]|nr:DUF4093 domain-containing protein [Clostridia bacterium]